MDLPFQIREYSKSGNERFRLPLKKAGQNGSIIHDRGGGRACGFQVFLHTNRNDRGGKKEVVAGCCRGACDGLNSLMACTIIYKNIDFFGIK